MAMDIHAMTDLVTLADRRAWAAAIRAVRNAPHGHRRRRWRRLHALVNEMLRQGR